MEKNHTHIGPKKKTDELLGIAIKNLYSKKYKNINAHIKTSAYNKAQHDDSSVMTWFVG